MNSSSVLLEGSLELSNGKTVSVDLKLLERYALFPGQVVALTGTNPTGKNNSSSYTYNKYNKYIIQFCFLTLVIHT